MTPSTLMNNPELGSLILLPIEVRLQIYNAYIDIEVEIPMPSSAISHNRERRARARFVDHSTRDSSPPPMQIIDLLLVSNTIREEFEPVMYSQYMFRLTETQNYSRDIGKIQLPPHLGLQLQSVQSLAFAIEPNATLMNDRDRKANGGWSPLCLSYTSADALNLRIALPSLRKLCLRIWPKNAESWLDGRLDRVYEQPVGTKRQIDNSDKFFADLIYGYIHPFADIKELRVQLRLFPDTISWLQFLDQALDAVKPKFGDNVTFVPYCHEEHPFEYMLLC